MKMICEEPYSTRIKRERLLRQKGGSLPKDRSEDQLREIAREMWSVEQEFIADVGIAMTESHVDFALAVEGIGVGDGYTTCWVEVLQSSNTTFFARRIRNAKNPEVSQRWTFGGRFAEGLCSLLETNRFWDLERHIGPEMQFDGTSFSVWAKTRKHPVHYSHISSHYTANVRQMSRMFHRLCSAPQLMIRFPLARYIAFELCI